MTKEILCNQVYKNQTHKSFFFIFQLHFHCFNCIFTYSYVQVWSYGVKAEWIFVSKILWSCCVFFMSSCVLDVDRQTGKIATYIPDYNKHNSNTQKTPTIDNTLASTNLAKLLSVRR